MSVDNSHTDRRLGVSSDRRVDRSGIWRFAIHEGQISARHRPIGQLGYEADNRHFRAGNHQQTTGVFVEAMDDSGSRQGRLIRPMVQNPIHQGAAPIARSRVSHQPRGLVDHQ
jgi:hypothetical protein